MKKLTLLKENYWGALSEFDRLIYFISEVISYMEDYTEWDNDMPHSVRDNLDAVNQIIDKYYDGTLNDHEKKWLIKMANIFINNLLNRVSDEWNDTMYDTIDDNLDTINEIPLEVSEIDEPEEWGGQNNNEN